MRHIKEFKNFLLEYNHPRLKDVEEKKKIKTEIANLKNKREEEIKKLIKERFNYQIAIAEVEKAWISTTWAVIENELEPLVKEFAEYRKQNNLW